METTNNSWVTCHTSHNSSSQGGAYSNYCLDMHLRCWSSAAATVIVRVMRQRSSLARISAWAMHHGLSRWLATVHVEVKPWCTSKNALVWAGAWNCNWDQVLNQVCAADNCMHLDLLLLTSNVLVMSCRKDSCKPIVTHWCRMTKTVAESSSLRQVLVCLLYHQGLWQLAHAYIYACRCLCCCGNTYLPNWIRFCLRYESTYASMHVHNAPKLFHWHKPHYASSPTADHDNRLSNYTKSGILRKETRSGHQAERGAQMLILTHVLENAGAACVNAAAHLPFTDVSIPAIQSSK